MVFFKYLTALAFAMLNTLLFGVLCRIILDCGQTPTVTALMPSVYISFIWGIIYLMIACVWAGVLVHSRSSAKLRVFFIEYILLQPIALFVMCVMEMPQLALAILLCIYIIGAFVLAMLDDLGKRYVMLFAIIQLWVLYLMLCLFGFIAIWGSVS